MKTRILDNDGKGNPKDGWVRAAVVLQGVVFLLAVWGSVDVLFLWSKYPPRAALVLLRALSWSTVEAVASGIAIAGLWKSKRWGWILAVLTDATMCLFTLSTLIHYSAPLLRNPRWLAFSVWDFAAIAVLLHQPVRAHFLSQMPQHRIAQAMGYAGKVRTYPGLGPSPKGAEPREMYWVERSVRVLFYFVAAVAAACFVTTFSVMFQLGEKAGAGRGFVLLLLFGFALGSGPSILFALLLTLAARVFGPSRLWAWLLVGVLLAPSLILGMGALASKMESARAGAWIFGFFFTGPLWLVQGWWLTIPAGLIAAFLCFQMFPWAFGEPRGTARPLRLQD